MEVTGPFNLTLGIETDVTPPNGSTRFTRVVLSNASPFACQVNVDGVGQWLQPWSADVYPISGGNPAQITPKFTTAAGASSAQITATWYLDTDPLSGTYPVPLTSQAIAGTITSLTPNSLLLAATTFNTDIGGVGSFQVTVPQGIESIAIWAEPLASAAGTNVVARFTTRQSGLALPSDVAFFRTIVALTPAANAAVIDVLSGANITIDFFGTAALASQTMEVFVVGYPQPAGAVRGPRTGPNGNPHSLVQDSATAGQNNPIIPAAPTGAVHEIVSMQLSGNSTVASGAQIGSIIDPVSGVGICSAYPTAAGLHAERTTLFYWPGALNINNIGVPVTVFGSVLYRDVPLN